MELPIILLIGFAIFVTCFITNSHLDHIEKRINKKLDTLKKILEDLQKL